MGTMSRREVTLLVLVCGALALWIGAIHYIEPAITAMLVVLLMVMCQGRDVERCHRTRAGLEHPGLVCDDGHAGRWPR